jgi:hypothetical protein
MASPLNQSKSTKTRLIQSQCLKTAMHGTVSFPSLTKSAVLFIGNVLCVCVFNKEMCSWGKIHTLLWKISSFQIKTPSKLKWAFPLKTTIKFVLHA